MQFSITFTAIAMEACKDNPALGHCTSTSVKCIERNSCKIRRNFSRHAPCVTKPYTMVILVDKLRIHPIKTIPLKYKFYEVNELKFSVKAFIFRHSMLINQSCKACLCPIASILPLHPHRRKNLECTCLPCQPVAPEGRLFVRRSKERISPWSDPLKGSHQSSAYRF